VLHINQLLLLSGEVLRWISCVLCGCILVMIQTIKRFFLRHLWNRKREGGREELPSWIITSANHSLCWRSMVLASTYIEIKNLLEQPIIEGLEGCDWWPHHPSQNYMKYVGQEKRSTSTNTPFSLLLGWVSLHSKGPGATWILLLGPNNMINRSIYHCFGEHRIFFFHKYLHQYYGIYRWATITRQYVFLIIWSMHSFV
jgi:hypothetical protein